MVPAVLRLGDSFVCGESIGLQRFNQVLNGVLLHRNLRWAWIEDNVRQLLYLNEYEDSLTRIG